MAEHGSEAFARSADIARLLESLSHELGTPLTVITTALHVLHRHLEGDSENRALSEDALEGAERFERALAHVRHLGRLRASSRPLVRLDLAVGPAIARFAAEDAGAHELVLDLPGVPATRLDTPALAHVTLELLRGAGTEAPPGTPLRVAIVAAPGGVELAIEHEAAALPGASARQDESASASLGAFVARFVVEAHAGRLSRSRAGGHARIAVWLPETCTVPTPSNPMELETSRMGDLRYDRAWADVFDATAPEDRARLLAHLPLLELVHLLGAQQAASHPLERNVVATALLNRLPHGGVDGLSPREIQDRIRDTERLAAETRSTAKTTRENVDQQRTSGRYASRQGRKA